MNKKIIILFLTITLVITLTGCSSNSSDNTLSDEEAYQKAVQNAVKITEVVEGDTKYYNVVIDYDDKLKPKDIGKIYGEKIKEKISDFPEILDSYIADSIDDNQHEEDVFNRVQDLKPQVPENYRKEISGMAAALANGDKDDFGDGKLSLNELYAANMLGDVLLNNACSAVSVFKERSKTDTTITGRNMDWDINGNKLSDIYAVTTFKNGDKSIVSIGFIGFNAVITGFNNDKIFAAGLTSTSGQKLISNGKYSYAYKVREALENENSINGIVNELNNDNYTNGHLVFLSSPNKSVVLENDIDDNNDKKLRYHDSSIKQNITDDVNYNYSPTLSNSIGAVNGFMLKDTRNNFINSESNKTRWSTLTTELNNNQNNNGDLTIDGIKNVISSKPLYNDRTIQTVLFVPETGKLKIAFRMDENQTSPKEFVDVENILYSY